MRSRNDFVRAHQVRGDPQIDWPWWTTLLAAVVPIGIVAGGLAQRDALLTLRPATAAALVALSPWLAEAAGSVVRRDFSINEWVFSAIVLGGGAVLLAHPTRNDMMPFLLVFLVGEMASRMTRLGGAAVAVAATAVMVGEHLAGRWDNSYPIWLFGIALGWFFGYFMKSQLRLVAQLKEAQAGLAEKAAAEERSRIAREVHDVIAHSMSVTMLHVTAARMALEKGQETEALDSLREAETQGRNSLNDIRRTVGLLGTDDGATEPPMPVAADLPKLVMDFRAAGLDVTLWMDGDVQALGPGAGLNIYRIVQESLTNATKHAPGAKARVELNVTDDDVRLRVHNGPSNGGVPQSAGGGLGLRGMVERAAMLGGTLAADSDESGWTVFLVAPRASD